MNAIIPAINGGLTVMENGFNLIGYLPKHRFPDLHVKCVTWRRYCGAVQLITGLAMISMGYFAHYAFPSLAVQSYLSIPLRMVCLGALYANHGIFNVLRSYMETSNISGITLAYDFYGKKFFPVLNPDFDLQSKFFKKIKEVLDRLISITVFPPEINIRSIPIVFDEVVVACNLQTT